MIVSLMLVIPVTAVNLHFYGNERDWSINTEYGRRYSALLSLDGLKLELCVMIPHFLENAR